MRLLLAFIAFGALIVFPFSSQATKCTESDGITSQNFPAVLVSKIDQALASVFQKELKRAIDKHQNLDILVGSFKAIGQRPKSPQVALVRIDLDRVEVIQAEQIILKKFEAFVVKRTAENPQLDAIPLDGRQPSAESNQYKLLQLAGNSLGHKVEIRFGTILIGDPFSGTIRVVTGPMEFVHKPELGSFFYRFENSQGKIEEIEDHYVLSTFAISTKSSPRYLQQ